MLSLVYCNAVEIAFRSTCITGRVDLTHTCMYLLAYPSFQLKLVGTALPYCAPIPGIIPRIIPGTIPYKIEYTHISDTANLNWRPWRGCARAPKSGRAELGV